MTYGLVLCGFAKTPAEAAGFLLEAAMSPDSENGQLPRANLTGAMSFLKTIAELGGLGADDEMVASLNRLKDFVEAFSSHSLTYLGAWAKACELFATEQLMLSVIRRASADASHGLEAQGEGAPEVPAVSRRRARAEV